MYNISPPNTISQEHKEFYISYNTRDYMTYGAITTALVIGDQMDICYILEGDHREGYKAIGDDLEKCIEYFEQYSDKINKYSDKIGKPTSKELVAADLKRRGY